MRILGLKQRTHRKGHNDDQIVSQVVYLESVDESPCQKQASPVIDGRLINIEGFLHVNYATCEVCRKVEKIRSGLKYHLIVHQSASSDEDYKETT